MRTLLVLGGGTAGTMLANRLRRRLDPHDWRIVVVDQDDEHHYQPGYIFVPFGGSTREEIVRSRHHFLGDGIELVLAEIDRVDPEARTVALADGRELAYDYLVIATGTTPRPDQTPGMLGPEWHRSIFDFYTLEGAEALADALTGLRPRPAGRAHHRDADQVPRRAARGHLPGRGVAAQARPPRPGGAGLRDAARRRLHQAGRVRAASARCSTERKIHVEPDFMVERIDARAAHPRLLRRARGALRPARSPCP